MNRKMISLSIAVVLASYSTAIAAGNKSCEEHLNVGQRAQYEHILEHCNDMANKNGFKNRRGGDGAYDMLMRSCVDGSAQIAVNKGQLTSYCSWHYRTSWELNH